MSTRDIDVLFVFPPAQESVGIFRNHLGAAYLRAVLAREGMTTAQYMSGSSGSIEAVAQGMIRRKSSVIGFTVYDDNAALCIALAQVIKRQQPRTRIVFGGPTATFGAQRLMEKHPVIDACVIGEGEGIVKQVFASLVGSDSIQGMPPGVAFRQGGEVVCTPLPPLLGTNPPADSALDVAPSPYLSGILDDGRAGLLTGRGCPHHCQYCCFAALGRNRLRLHSMDRVLAELEYIAEHQKHTGTSYTVTIHDDAFTLLPMRAKALCEAIADRGLHVDLSCITRADTVDEELLKLMREAGFVSIAFGLESAVPSVLRAVGKVRPPDWHDPDLEPEKRFLERVRASVLGAKKYGFHVGLSIILGLPTETAADGATTLSFVESLPVDYYMHNLLWVFPGTPLWETHDSYGIGCAINEIGLAVTTRYAYDVTALKPGLKCGLEQDADLVRLWATDTLFGCDALPMHRKGIGAVIVNGEVSAQTAEWLKGILNVGGVLIQLCRSMKRREQDLQIERNRSVLNSHLVTARWHIQLRPTKSNSEDERWLIACPSIDLYDLHHPSSVAITSSHDATPLIAWAKGVGRYAMLCELSEYLQKPGALESLRNRLETQDAASPLRRMPVPPQVKYPGRWLKGRAPCRKLTRIEIDADGNVRTCRQGKLIGRIGDSPKDLSKALTDFIKTAEQRRGCAQCLNEHCPRCPFPGVEDEQYCQIMTEYERRQRFLNWMRIYSRLPLLVAVQQDNMTAT